MDLARAKSKALNNIYSLLKQYMKLCNAKRWKQQEWWIKQQFIGLITKKATLHMLHTFIVHFFAVVLHDYNVKLPETS